MNHMRFILVEHGSTGTAAVLSTHLRFSTASSGLPYSLLVSIVPNNASKWYVTAKASGGAIQKHRKWTGKTTGSRSAEAELLVLKLQSNFHSLSLFYTLLFNNIASLQEPNPSAGFPQ